MKQTILVVDDNPDVILTVKAGLEDSQNKYSIIGANSGEKCLKLLDDSQLPDLILLDIMMPEMTGWETFDLIKENESWKDIPIVLLTARTDRIAKNAGDFLGDDYIEKPFEVNDLKARIDKVLNNK